LKGKESNEIIVLHPASNSYVDEYYFKEVFGEYHVHDQGKKHNIIKQQALFL